MLFFERDKARQVLNDLQFTKLNSDTDWTDPPHLVNGAILWHNLKEWKVKIIQSFVLCLQLINGTFGPDGQTAKISSIFGQFLGVRHLPKADINSFLVLYNKIRMLGEGVEILAQPDK